MDELTPEIVNKISEYIISNIVDIKEVVNGLDSNVTTLRNTGLKRILDRKIIAWKELVADYGTGGIELYGFLLDNTSDYDKEWLVLRLGDPGTWLLLDGKYVAVSIADWDIKKGLYKSTQYDDGYDNFGAMIIGQTIVNCDCGSNYIILKLSDGKITHILEIPQDKKKLTRYGSVQNLSHI